MTTQDLTVTLQPVLTGEKGVWQKATAIFRPLVPATGPYSRIGPLYPLFSIFIMEKTA